MDRFGRISKMMQSQGGQTATAPTASTATPVAQPNLRKTPVKNAMTGVAPSSPTPQIASGTPASAGPAPQMGDNAPKPPEALQTASEDRTRGGVSGAIQHASDAKANAPGEQAPDPYAEYNQIYEDIIGDHDKSWEAKEQMVARQGAAAQRQNAAMNARMGRAVGGAFGAGMAQATLSTNEQLLDERTRHDEQKRSLQLEWLDKQLQNQWRTEDRDFEREMFDRGAALDQQNLEAQLSQTPNYDIDKKLDEMFGSGHNISANKWKAQTQKAANKIKKYRDKGLMDHNYNAQQQEDLLKAFYKKMGRFPSSNQEWKQVLGAKTTGFTDKEKASLALNRSI